MRAAAYPRNVGDNWMKLRTTVVIILRLAPPDPMGIHRGYPQRKRGGCVYLEGVAKVAEIRIGPIQGGRGLCISRSLVGKHRE